MSDPLISDPLISDRPTYSSPAHLVEQFHARFELPTQELPGHPDPDLAAMRLRIIDEEFEELRQAVGENDLVEIADALADIVYVAYGTALTYGIPLDELLEEVHASNMSKLGPGGTALKRSDGKVLKGPDFFEPRIAEILGR